MFALTMAACGGGQPSKTSTSAPTSSASASSTATAPPTVVGVTSCKAAVASAAAPKAATGTIYYDRNQNGRQDPGEQGLGGLAVYLSHGADSTTPGADKSPATCTDSSGHYSLTPPDKFTGYRVELRTGWFRSQCAHLTCPHGGPGNNMAVGKEWIYSDAFTGATSHTFNAGLIPDAGQYVANPNASAYSGYPPDLTKAHHIDLAVRFTDDLTVGCTASKKGVISCQIGTELDQTLYIANSGLEPVSGIQAVIQLPYGEVHNELVLLHSASTPGVSALSNLSVAPPTGPRQSGKPATSANYTTITFTVAGTIPAAGQIAVVSRGTLATGKPKTLFIGRAGVSHENDASQDSDSALCTTPEVRTACAGSDTYSFLDQHGDDVGSDRFNLAA